MLNKFFMIFTINYKQFNSSVSYIEKINLYKQILYPTIKFKIKEEDLKKNDFNSPHIEGVYFSINNNEHLIELEDFYTNHKKLVDLIKMNSIKIDNYDCDLLILNEYKKKINFQNISINNIQNSWFNKIIQYESLNNKHTIKEINLVNSRKYQINLNDKELNLLKKNLTVNINYLIYLLENLNILQDVLSVFNPFNGKQVSIKELENMLKKQIIVYIYNNIYKTY